MNPSSRRTWQVVVLVFLISGILLLALSGYLNMIVSSAIKPLIGTQTWFSERFMTIIESLTAPSDVVALRQRNVDLENQVSQLELQLIQLQQQLREAQVLYSLLDFARARPENQYAAAAVIGRDPSPFLHYIIIDHGSDDGLRHGMPVVTQQGLVGRVDAVTAGAARVQLITDPGSAVNISLPAHQSEALLIGSVTGEVSLDMVQQSLKLTPGEVVLTSGLGGGYPSDILIGQISGVRKRETALYQTATVQSAVNFQTLRVVLVIKNFRPTNISPLIPATGQ